MAAATVQPRHQSGKLSEEARETLIEELEQPVGKEAVEQADVDVDRAISERPHPIRTAFSSSKLLIGGRDLTSGLQNAIELPNEEGVADGRRAAAPESHASPPVDALDI